MSQAQPVPQRHGCPDRQPHWQPAAAGVTDAAWQPQVQEAPGQSRQRQALAGGVWVFIAKSSVMGGDGSSIRSAILTTSVAQDLNQEANLSIGPADVA